MAYHNPNKDLQLRSEIIQGDQQSKTEEVFENPQNAVSMQRLKMQRRSMLSFYYK